MIQWTCPDCDNDTWTAHGEVMAGSPEIREIRCTDCGAVRGV